MAEFHTCDRCGDVSTKGNTSCIMISQDGYKVLDEIEHDLCKKCKKDAKELLLYFMRQKGLNAKKKNRLRRLLEEVIK